MGEKNPYKIVATDYSMITLPPQVLTRSGLKGMSQPLKRGTPGDLLITVQ